MQNKSYLTFSHHDLSYGVDIELVQEIFLLPELISFEDTSGGIIGILNLRSQALPTIHLDLRFGYEMEVCQLSDSVIVLQWQGLQVGIIANQLYETREINLETVRKSDEQKSNINLKFITGVAKLDTDILLLNPEELIPITEVFNVLLSAEAFLTPDAELNNVFQHQLENEFIDIRSLESSTISNFYDRCCPDATLEAKRIFHQRAEDLKLPIEEPNSQTELMPLAVVGLDGEYFGVDLDLVREFINIRDITPIPCCPPYIVGNINLRGEIVTLVDIRGVLNMPLVATNTSKAIVIDANDVVAGLSIDEVFEVMYLDPSEMTVLTAVQINGNAYWRGTAPYAEKLLNILDLPKIFTQGELVVEDTVD